MAAVTSAPGLPRSRLHMESDLSTLPDPRSPDEFPSPQGSSASSPHPDLNSEVATLSNKLISAINHQTNLDDALAATRQELEASQERVKQLETENREHANLVSTGALVRRTEVEEQASKLVAKLAEERKRRTVVEKDKKGIEQELENLTTALFEEANQMVAAARKEREAAERRNEQLRVQLNDTELLLASHQEQLAELKSVMERMNANRDEVDNNTNGSTAPSTPALPAAGESNKVPDALAMTPAVSGVDDVSPAPPTSFSHLLSLVLRTDLQTYEDFHSLLQISRQSTAGSRVNSGSYGGVTIPGLSNFTTRTDGQPAHLPSNGSTASLSTPAVFPSSSTTSPNTTASVTASPVIPLKETRFYKRALTEDIEPTLRLDTAPGLSWLARRTVINSMCEGTLVVEPMPVSSKVHIFSCALCGENRKGEVFTRAHRFRTSESENAQRYPLCSYCLNRVRSSCDYLGFLRMVKDGHWRTDGVEAEKAAWEESVRLRERMFWARIGGGVIPTFVNRESPRPSVEDAKPHTPYSALPTLNTSLSSQKDVSKKENGDPIHSSVKQASIGKKIITRRDSDSGSDYDWETVKKAPIFDDTAPPSAKSIDLPGLQLHTSLRESLRPRPRSRAASYEKERTSTIIVDHDTSPQQSSAPQRGLTVHRALSPTATSTNEQGLQITIPGEFQF